MFPSALQTSSPLSVQDFEVMADSDTPSELIHGILHFLTANNPIHAELCARLACILQTKCVQDNLPLRVLSGEVGVVIRDGEAGTVRAADLAVISKERLPDLPKSGFLRVMPELLVEIISGSNTWTDT